MNFETTLSGRSQRYASHYAAMGNNPPDWGHAKPFGKREIWLPEDRDMEVLDFGCGLGGHLSRLWACGFTRLAGVDVCRDMVEAAVIAAGSEAKIVCTDGREWLRGNRDRYGLILMFDVLEHFGADDAVSLLGEAHAALRQGGRLVVRTPNMQALTAGYSRYLDLTHCSGFTQSSLRQAFFAAGFETTTVLADRSEWEPRKWRPWKPWRGLGLRAAINHCLHRAVYGLRGRLDRPFCFDMNLEAYADRE